MIKQLAFVALVVTILCSISPAEGQLRNTCTSSKPYRCPNGTCVATSSLCNVNPCSGTTPYLCSDNTCQISAIYCNCNGTVCWDGSCKTTVTDCPLLPQCPEEYPKRCPNGVCKPYNDACVNNTGTPCPSGLELCIDGICRSSSICIDVPYSGCPYIQCPNGNCATTWSTCECSPGVALCYDGTCMPIGTGAGFWPKCNVTAPAFINPNNLTATTETGSSSSFTTTSSSSSTPVVTVVTSSGALTGTSSAGTGYAKRVDVYIDNIWVRAVPTPTTIYSVTEDDAGNWFNVTIASPVASITSELGQVHLNAGSPINLLFHEVWLAPGQDYCVAWLDTSIGEGTWRCLNNTLINNVVGDYGDVSGEANRLGIFAVIKKEIYQCTSVCPETPCAAVVYDLKTEDGLITVGTLTVNNKMDIEMQFEVNLYEDRFNSNYGWKLTGLRIEVGSKILNLEYSGHSANYREFTTVQMRDAFPGDNNICQTNRAFFVSISVQDDGPCPNKKRTEPTCPPTYRIVYAFPQNKRTVGPLPPTPTTQQRTDFTRQHNMCCTCAYRAELISNLGRTCAQVSTGCYRDAKFDRSYPYGLTVGCAAGYTMTFHNSTIVQKFLDRFENQWNNFASALTQNYVDFTGFTPAGQLAGYVTSLSLNDRFDRLDINFAESCNWLRNLYICGGTCAPFQGMTIGELLKAGNDVLGGCASTSTYNPSQLVSCFDQIERTFDKGKRLEHFRNRGFDIVPCV